MLVAKKFVPYQLTQFAFLTQRNRHLIASLKFVHQQNLPQGMPDIETYMKFVK